MKKTSLNRKLNVATFICAFPSLVIYCFAFLLATIFILPLALISFLAATILIAVSRELNRAIRDIASQSALVAKTWSDRLTNLQRHRKVISGFDSNEFIHN